MKYYKELTKDKAITIGPEAENLFLPLIQHIGTPCEPLVKIGDEVKVGQKIAQAEAFITAPIHAPVSGKVSGIDQKPHPNGNLVKTIILENDKKYLVDDSVVIPPDYLTLSSQEIIEIIKEAGIVGLGGATFPTHVKLSPPKGKTLDTLLINGAECEPFLTTDYRLMLENGSKVLQGAKIIAKALGITNIIIAIEDNKKLAIKQLKSLLSSKDTINIKSIKTKYPQGAEKYLVRTVLNRKVPPLGIPLDVGVLVINVASATQIALTFETGLPLIERIVTISGTVPDLSDYYGNFKVRLGTPFKLFWGEKWEAQAETLEKTYKFVLGGPMMGLAQWSLDVPVIKGTSGLLALNPYQFEESACIRCARCVKVCPLGLMPLFDADDSCMECGCCAFVCPAKRQLVQRIRSIKQLRLNARNK